jgi:hypothetical protein
MADETYKAHVFCKNCLFRGELDVVKKTMVEDTECPQCGNATIEKDLNAHLGKISSQEGFY